MYVLLTITFPIVQVKYEVQYRKCLIHNDLHSWCVSLLLIDAFFGWNEQGAFRKSTGHALRGAERGAERGAQ
jgi:hypothetical protein